MKTIYSIFAFAGLSMAHNVMTHFHINGVANPDCVRQAVSTNPLTVLDSNDMACNAVKGNGASKCTVKPGDTIAFEWRADPNIPAAQYPLKDGTIPVGVTDDSHKGPCAVYMKKVDDSSNAVGAGDGWFKVSEDGLLNGVFCTDRLRLANLPQPGVLPTDIEAGDYLMRAEFLTLNNAGPSPNPPVFDSNGVQEGGQPQFYVGCVQVTVEGTSGTANPSTVSIPGYVNINSPGLLFDIWNTPSNIFSNYPMPGPTPLLADGTPGTIAGSPDTVPSVVPSATGTATKTPAGTPAGTPASSAKPTTKASTPTTVAAVSPTDDGSDNTPTSAPSTPTTPAFTHVAPTDGGSDAPTPTFTHVRPTDTPDNTPAPTATPTHYSNIKYVTATTLITRTSTLRPHATSPAESDSDDSDATATGDVPHSTHHRGYHGARGHGSHRRRAL